MAASLLFDGLLYHSRILLEVLPFILSDPNDEKHEPFWKVVEDLDFVVFSHCGWVSRSGEWARRRLSSLTATPFHFEVPARKHPKVRFIFAHFGGAATYLETIVLLSRLPNCFADTCPGWGKWVWENRLPGLKGLDRSKVLFGTDGEQGGKVYGARIQWWARTLRSYGYPEAGLRKYFRQNALHVLHLKSYSTILAAR